MKNFSSILLISLGLAACTPSNQSEVNNAQGAPRQLPVPHATIGIDTPGKSTIGENESRHNHPASKTSTSHQVPYLLNDVGMGKDSNLHEQAYRDSIFSPKNMQIEMRRHDSLRIVGLRKSAIRDSLQKLQQDDH